MPIENERKYVLFRDNPVVVEIAKAAAHGDTIVQSYIQTGDGWNIRVREIRPYYSDLSDIDPDDRIYDSKYVDHILTYKQLINDELIEIETTISSKDYQKLHKQSSNTLSKIRYKIIHRSNIWEVDLFYRGFSDFLPYFIQAEIEMPAGQIEPTSIPSVISKHLLYEVPRENDEFSNTKLGNLQYAEEKYQELLKARIKNE